MKYTHEVGVLEQHTATVELKETVTVGHLRQIVAAADDFNVPSDAVVRLAGARLVVTWTENRGLVSRESRTR